MTWVGTAVVLIGAAITTYNTIETQNRMDDQALAGIQQQGRRQRDADQKVDQAVQELEQSSAQDARREALRSYTAALDANKRSAAVGMAEGIGSDAFKEGSARATDSVRQYGMQNAQLLSTIEGAGTQRMNEGFSYGRLGTDIAGIGRQAAGDQFVNDLKMRGIQRNPWLDFAAGVATGAGGALAGGGGGEAANAAPTGNGSPYKSGPTPNKNYRKGG